MTSPIPVTVLGATGLVGQRFVRRLAGHPWFSIAHLVASERSAGLRYAEACTWRAGGPPHAGWGETRLEAIDEPRQATPVVFSALESELARDVEPAFARQGSLVFSNASAWRMEKDIPLLVPEVNPRAIELLDRQKSLRDWSGGIVTNPNCVTAILSLPLAALHRARGLAAVRVSTFQALSGAGARGLFALDALDNVIPHILGEASKISAEMSKILAFEDEKDGPVISASCHRVPVGNGHGMDVSLAFRGATPTVDEASRLLATFRGDDVLGGLPTSPSPPLRVHGLPDRPQHVLDLSDTDMTVHVGNLEPCPVMGLKLYALGHNLERGAAGGSLLNAELARAMGYIRS
ncbi:MAG TPA: aspartate-semialdehyde dehydrogenase [Planctomycetes bacterium]|nr:aspartate-semialdehyde dehydrogenase [Planctomycetota bacterium]